MNPSLIKIAETSVQLPAVKVFPVTFVYTGLVRLSVGAGDGVDLITINDKSFYKGITEDIGAQLAGQSIKEKLGKYNIDERKIYKTSSRMNLNWSDQLE